MLTPSCVTAPPAAPARSGVGTDTSRYGHHACFLRDDLQPAADELTFAESAAGYEQLRQRLALLALPAARYPAVTFVIRLVAAADLIPHALNPRTHGATQREALRAMLDSVGLGRSLLADVADAHRHLGERAPLTLIDGHLRRDELGDGQVVVEVLDVNDDEARMLLLTMDPLASLAGYDESKLDELRSHVRTDSDALNNLWASVADGQRAAERAMKDAAAKRKKEAEAEAPRLVEKYVVIIECASETQQVEALRLCKEAGFQCRAVMS